MELVIHKTKSELQSHLKNLRGQGLSVGLVPTMGALHKGHLSLLKKCGEENDISVCSIFVNPTQFNNPKDLEKYPRPVEADVKMLETAGCSILFMPSVDEMYGPSEKWHIDLGEIENVLEGRYRPGHYQGVTQVVNKLLRTVSPVRAYFGQKDYQQFLIISRMVELLHIPVQLVCCPTVREENGLAMSSRNLLLNEEDRNTAIFLSQTLFWAKSQMNNLSPAQIAENALQMLEKHKNIKPEYFQIVNADDLRAIQNWDDAQSVIALTAVFVGETRLIDNLFLKTEEES